MKEPGHSHATAPDVDPLTREVVLAAVKSITYEMEGIVGRAAMSESFRDKKDYFIGIFSTAGDMFHALTSYSGAGMVRPVLAHYPAEQMHEGDLFFFNDPYLTDGAVQHLPDSVLCAPIVSGDQVVGMAAAFGHVADVGGANGRNNARAVRDVWNEGIAYPPMQVGRDWAFDDWFFRMLQRNTRQPRVVSGDLAALMSACRLGASRFAALCAKHGADAVSKSLAWEISETRRRAMEILTERLTPGVYETEQKVSITGLDEARTVRLKLTWRGAGLDVDLTATDDQVEVPMNYMCSHDGLSLLLALQMLVFDGDLVLNEGLLSLLGEVTLREGSLVRPKFPAPIQERSHVKSAVSNCLGAALALASNGGMTAAQPTYAYAEFQFSDHTFMETLGVGLGARPFADGPDVVYAPAQRNYPIEFVEGRHPVVVEKYEIVRDSGGAGTFRGGSGVRRVVRVLDDCAVSPMISNTIDPSPGTSGGAPGALGYVTVHRQDGTTEVYTGVATAIPVRAGDVVELVTPGGGGWGDPRQRRPDLVRRDVVEGFISAEQAIRDYGTSFESVVDVPAVEIGRAAR